MPEIVRDVFGLRAVPPPETDSHEVPGWDSLGALRLVLAIEAAFGIALSEDELTRIHRVEDLMEAVESSVAGPGVAQVAS